MAKNDFDYFEITNREEVKTKTKCECALYTIAAYLNMTTGTLEDVENSLIAVDEACTIPGSDKLIYSFKERINKLDNQVKKEMVAAGYNPDDYNSRGEALRAHVVPSYPLFGVLQQEIVREWLENLQDNCDTASFKKEEPPHPRIPLIREE